MIARAVTRARKAKPTRKKTDSARVFWDRLAYSRIVEWGKEFFRVRDYLITK